MFDAPEPLWVRWERACDFLDADIESGYVRILQEMIAAGWSDPEVAAAVREMTRRLVRACWRRSPDARQERGGDLGAFTPDEVAALMGTAVPGRRGADPARRHRVDAADALGAAQGRCAPAAMLEPSD